MLWVHLPHNQLNNILPNDLIDWRVLGNMSTEQTSIGNANSILALDDNCLGNDYRRDTADLVNDSHVSLTHPGLVMHTSCVKLCVTGLQDREWRPAFKMI